MTNNEIVERLYREHKVQRIMEWHHPGYDDDPFNLLNELVSDIYLILLKQPNARLNEMYSNMKQLNAFIMSIIRRQLGCHGAYRKMFTQYFNTVPASYLSQRTLNRLNDFIYDKD